MTLHARLMWLGATITLLNACDLGGTATATGSGSFAVSDGATFSLASVQSLAPDFARSFPVTGTDTGSASLSGTWSVQNLATTPFNGQPATPRTRTLALTDLGTNGFTTTQNTLYLGAGFQILGAVDNLSAVTCLPTTPLATLPLNVAIGDRGELGDLLCTDGNRRRYTWRIDGAAGGRAVAVLITEIDAGGIRLAAEEEGLVIDAAGGIHGVTLITRDLVNGDQLILQSPFP